MKATPITPHFQGIPVPCAVYLMKDGWYWLFYGIEKTAVIKEDNLADWLGLTPATLKNWRQAKSPANGALLYLAFLHYTGQILPEGWRKDGFYFAGENLHRTAHTITRKEAKSIDFMRWQLRQATEALSSLPGFCVDKADKLPRPIPPEITGADPLSRHEP